MLCEKAGLKEKKPLWDENDGGQIPGSGSGECESGGAKRYLETKWTELVLDMFGEIDKMTSRFLACAARWTGVTFLRE